MGMGAHERLSTRKRIFPHAGLVIGLTAPSGSGKTWVSGELHREGAVRGIPSWTTRPPRPGEQDSHDHVFVSDRVFERMRSFGGFTLHLQLYGHRYGLLPLPLALEPLMISIKDTLIPAFRRTFPCAQVYHMESEDGREKMESIMRGERGQADDDIALRLAAYDAEATRGRALADRVFISPGHPKYNLPRIRTAIEEDARTHSSGCQEATYNIHQI